MEAAADALLGEAACLELLAAVSIRTPPRRKHARIACAHTLATACYRLRWAAAALGLSAT